MKKITKIVYFSIFLHPLLLPITYTNPSYLYNTNDSFCCLRRVRVPDVIRELIATLEGWLEFPDLADNIFGFDISTSTHRRMKNPFLTAEALLGLGEEELRKFLSSQPNAGNVMRDINDSLRSIRDISSLISLIGEDNIRKSFSYNPYAFAYFLYWVREMISEDRIGEFRDKWERLKSLIGEDKISKLFIEDLSMVTSLLIRSPSQRALEALSYIVTSPCRRTIEEIKEAFSESQTLNIFSQLYSEDSDAFLKLTAWVVLSFLHPILIGSEEYKRLRTQISHASQSFYVDIADSGFSFQQGIVGRVTLEQLLGIIVHEIIHNIIGFKLDYHRYNKAVNEFLADIGAFCLYTFLNYEQPHKIFAEMLYYEKMARELAEEEKKEMDKRIYEEHMVARAQLYYLLEAFEKRGIRIDWANFLKIGIRLYSEDPSLRFKDFVRKLLFEYFGIAKTEIPDGGSVILQPDEIEKIMDKKHR